MATPNNFYWVGGATSTSGSYTNRLGNFSGYTGTANMDWVLAFDWNNPRNWRILVPITSGATGGINGFTYADRCPAIEDNAIFGDYNAGVTGFTPGGAGPSVWTLPKAMAPCLWGGASAAGITITWVGGNDAGTNALGTTYNSSLNQIIVRHFNDAFVAGSTMQKYPFSYLGYGLGIANAAVGGAGNEYSPLYDAQSRGFTLSLAVWGGASWESLVDAVVATAGSIEHLNQLRVKCPTIITAPEDPSGKYIGLNPAVVSAGLQPGILLKNNWGEIQITNMKVLSQFGSGTTAAVYVPSVATIRGSANAYISGYFFNVYRDCSTLLSFASNRFAPRGTLTLHGVTANSVQSSGKVGSVYVSAYTNIGTMTVNPQDTFYNLDVQGVFLRESVLVDNGNYGQTAGSNTGGDPNLIVYASQFLSAATASASPVPPGFPRKGVYIGSAGTTVKANQFQFGSEPPISSGTAGWDQGHIYYGENQYVYGYPTIVNFQGNAQVNKITTNRAFVGASPEISQDTSVEMKELRLGNWSVLDMRRNGSFDNWKFGAQVGNAIVGGIVFDDENSMIRMSEGVALWNEQLIVGSNFVGGGSQVGKRNGNATTSPGSFI